MYPVTISEIETIHQLTHKLRHLSGDDIRKECKNTCYNFDLDEFFIEDMLYLNPEDVIDELLDNDGLETLRFYDLNDELRAVYSLEAKSIVDMQDLEDVSPEEIVMNTVML